MKTQFKYARLVELPAKGVTSIWSCRSRNDFELGVVKWYSAWRRYCYFPEADAVYSAGCLRDIAVFIDSLMSLRQKEKP